jgi:hypothetical protein
MAAKTAGKWLVALRSREDGRFVGLMGHCSGLLYPFPDFRATSQGFGGQIVFLQ